MPPLLVKRVTEKTKTCTSGFLAKWYVREARVFEVVSKPASRKTIDWPVIWPVVKAGNSPDRV